MITRKCFKKCLTSVLLSAFAVNMAFTSPSTALTANAAKVSAKKVVKQYEKGNYSKARKLAEKLPETANEKAVKKMSSKMKKAYRKKLKSFNTKTSIYSQKPYMWDYFLSDIDKDGKPELLVQYGTCEADVRLLVFTYKKGRVIDLGFIYAAHSGFYAYPDGNGLIRASGHMFGENVYKITIENGSAVSRPLGGTRMVKDTDEYIDFPYQLKDHKHYSKDYRRSWFDYSELK